MDKSYFIRKDVKVLDLLSKVDGIHFHVIKIDGMDWYDIIAVARDLQKRGLINHSHDGLYNITEDGRTYLNQNIDKLIQL